MDTKSIRVVFMGTPEFAVASLKALNEAGIDIVGVVSSPDKPAGRGKQLKSSEVKLYAESKLECPVLQPANLKDAGFIEKLRSLDADMFVVVAFRMLPAEVWTLPHQGTINLHASLLPQYRGAAPINWSIINGETQTGVTTFLIDHKIDTGRILLQESASIEQNDTAGSLHDKLMNLGSELIVKTVIKHMADDTEAIDQEAFNIPESDLKPAPKIFKEDCKINWNKKSQELINLIRGLSPYPGAFSVLQLDDGREFVLKIYAAEVKSTGTVSYPGRIYSDNKAGIQVECGDGIIDIAEIQSSGKKRMSAAEFVRGFPFDLTKGKFK